MLIRRVLTSLLVLAPALAAGSNARGQTAPLAETFLLQGKLQEGSAALAARLQEAPNDDQARFGLGVVEFLQGVERLTQSLHQYGLRSTGGNSIRDQVPFLRLPLPDNPNPKKLSYAASREVLLRLAADLERAEKTLAGVGDERVKLPLHFGLIRLDLDGDGRASEQETLWRLYGRLNRGVQVSEEQAKGFVIAFDYGDVRWLRGYCHLLMALAEIALAHDGQELFDCTAHLFFKNVDSPHTFLPKGKRVFDYDDVDIIDAIALIHLLRLPVKEPPRMAAALGHLQAMARESRASWKAILAETDDDHEWIPNPRQTGVIPNVRVTVPMVESWTAFIDELDQLLAGKRLVPFWRGDGSRGVNLRRVFTEPRSFDLVLWIQGTAAGPYLEEGEMTRKEVWDRLLQVFQGQFIGFALWFN